MRKLLVVLGPPELADTTEGVAWGLPLVAQAVEELPAGATVLAGGPGPGGWSRRVAEVLGRRWVEFGADGWRRQLGAEPKPWREGAPPLWQEHLACLVDSAGIARRAGWAVQALALTVPGSLGPAELGAAWLEREGVAEVERVEVPAWILPPPRKIRRPVQIWTARVNYTGTDGLSIARGKGDPAGLPFAPSWSILAPMLEARRAQGEAGVEALWPGYVEAYRAEMWASQAKHPEAWTELLSRPRATLLCFCPNLARCHRWILADMLRWLGADVRGERPRAGRPVAK